MRDLGRMHNNGWTILYSGHEEQHVRSVGMVLYYVLCRSQWSSSSMSDCSVRGPGIESHCGQLCLSLKTTVIYSLGHGLCAPFL